MNQWTAERIELFFRSFSVPKDFGTSEVPRLHRAKSAKIQFHPVSLTRIYLEINNFAKRPSPSLKAGVHFKP